jgi:pimeloyl-ACP methyl ester carboxylesterase
MATWSEHDLSTEDNTIHYYRMGQRTKPPVVLLHGFADAGLCWLRLATDLAQDYDLVMIDAPGHGRSGTGPEPERFREQAVADVLEVIDALALDRPALIGHSMGAATAASVAVWSSRIRCMVLEDPRWRDAPGELEPVESPGIAQVRSQKCLSREQLRAVANTERSMWSEVDRLHWVDARDQFNLQILEHGPISPLEPWREIVKDVRCPVLLLTADPERGAFITPEIAHEAMRLLRAGSLAHIPGAGHNIRREHYEPYRVAVASYLGQEMVAC